MRWFLSRPHTFLNAGTSSNRIYATVYDATYTTTSELENHLGWHLNLFKNFVVMFRILKLFVNRLVLLKTSPVRATTNDYQWYS